MGTPRRPATGSGTRVDEVPEGGMSDVLVTKVMLGVFGNVPAFNTYFKAGAGVSDKGASQGRCLLRRRCASHRLIHGAHLGLHHR